MPSTVLFFVMTERGSLASAGVGLGPLMTTDRGGTANCSATGEISFGQQHHVDTTVEVARINLADRTTSGGVIFYFRPRFHASGIFSNWWNPKS